MAIWAARTVCETAIQVHGGIGNTWECAAQVDVRRALPGVADTAVHLNRRLTDRSGGTRTVDLGDLGRPNGL
ncbi:hypothetical protein MAHJHV28_46690 [Mycobacterium avium subsp. hominissuis]